MKPYVFLICIAILTACTKKNQNIPIDAGLKANFGFKPGSYWVYKDSITGRIDSFVVTIVNDAFVQQSSYIHEEQMNIYMVDYKSGDSVSLWDYGMEENGLGLGFQYKDDTLHDNGCDLFTYPVKMGGGFTIDPDDTGIIINTSLDILLNGHNFSNTIVSYHTNHSLLGPPYSNWFYIDNNIGIIKIDFNYPTETIHRVMELQTYKILK